MSIRSERKERGLEKVRKYGEIITIEALALVEKKVIQNDFHKGIMLKRQAMEKACPQEKALIANAMAEVSARLMDMESKLKVSAPKPEKKDGKTEAA